MKLLMLILKVTEGTTEHQKLPEGQTKIGQRPKPSVGTQSRPTKWAVLSSSLQKYRQLVFFR